MRCVQNIIANSLRMAGWRSFHRTIVTPGTPATDHELAAQLANAARRYSKLLGEMRRLLALRHRRVEVSPALIVRPHPPRKVEAEGNQLIDGQMRMSRHSAR